MLFNFLSSTKGTCNCASYPDIETGAILNKRSFESNKLLQRLELVAEYNDGQYQLRRCPVCGQLWQRSLNWSKGNRPYAFRIPTINVEDWLAKPFVSPDDLLRRFWHLNDFLKSAHFEERDAVCKRPGCEEQAIRLSALCALHHIQSLGYKTDAPDDFRWFGPFEKARLDLTIDDLKALPNYKAIR